MSLSGSLRVSLTGTISSARDLGTAAVTESLSHLVTVTRCDRDSVTAATPRSRVDEMVPVRATRREPESDMMCSC